MSYEVVRAESLEALTQEVNHAISFRNKMPIGGVAVELKPIREKISETQAVHSIKTFYSQAVVSVDMMAGVTIDLNDAMRRHHEQRQAFLKNTEVPLPPVRKKRKSKKR